MIKEKGTVVSVSANELIVEVLRTSACQSCKARQGCGQATLAQWGEASKQQAKNHFKIPYDKQDAHEGDVVELGIAPDTVSLIAMIVYLVPLVFGFAGIAVGAVLNLNEGLQIGLFVTGLSASYWLMSRLFSKNKVTLVPVILQLYPQRKGVDIIESNQVDTV